MKASFFPGCSLEGTAREYGESIEAVCSILHIELEELEDWSCCGASSAHCTSDYLSTALPARNLAIAERMGLDLVTPCAACFNRLKTAASVLENGAQPGVDVMLSGHIRVMHIVDLLGQEDMLSAIAQKITRPLTPLKAVSYYGCLLVRPPKILKSTHWEDPTSLDRIVQLTGAESVFWPYKTECCGGSMVLTSPDVFYRLTSRILDMAIEAGADCIVTACPLCQSNLDSREDEIGRATGSSYSIPVFYFTELLGMSFGHKDARRWMKRHIIDPVPLLNRKGLL